MESKPDKLKIKDDVFKSGNGTTLHYRSWTPAVKSEMVIALVHGLGEHSGRNNHWAQRFNRQSIAFTSFDLRRHGLSGGKRGSIILSSRFGKKVIMNFITSLRTMRCSGIL